MLVPQRGSQTEASAKQRAGVMSTQLYQPALYQQPGPYHLGACQTISRSSNLHQPHHLAMLRAHQQQNYATWLPQEPSYSHNFSFNRPYQQQTQQDYFLHQQHQSLTMGRSQRPRSMMSATMGRQQANNKQHQQQQRPLCKCRVIYLGSSVPHVTKNGLHGIQEPLKHLYPEEQFSVGSPVDKTNNPEAAIDISHLSSGLGIDSWMSVWSNGLLLENVDELGRQVSRFFAIDSLHYCAAVRYFDTRKLSNQQQPQLDVNNNSQEAPRSHFLPLDAPIFRLPQMLDPAHPPVFAAIMRRTSGVKVLECHAFICRRDAAANALVRCCTQSYGDLLNAKRLSLELGADEVRRRRPAPQNQMANAITSGSQRSSAGSGRSRRRPMAAAAAVDEPAGAAKSSSDEAAADNYAIIARGHHQAAKDSTQRQRRGSSRSLFTEFAPPELAAESPIETAIDEARRLSQSLDLLRIDSSANDTCCDQHYSVVAQRRHRRHSRSMHNLERTSELGAGGGGGNGARRRHPATARDRNRRRHQPSQPLNEQHQYQHRRRSASVHDIHTTPNQRGSAERIYEPAPISAKSERRRAKQASTRHQRQAQPSPPPPPPPIPGPPQHQQQVYLPPHPLYLGGPHAHAHHPAYHMGHPPAYLSYYPAPTPAAYLAHHQHQARFMRLSPPLSYLEQAGELPGKATARNRDEEQQVVSGQPCFVANTNGARHSATDKKMSWIKRLSLTMSAGSVSLAPAGRPTNRKRTSLFAGGLTLGRTRPPSDVISGGQ